MKAYELISDKSKFCTNHFAVNNIGEDTNPGYYNGRCDAVKWDMVGAVKHCYPNIPEFKAIIEKLQQYIFAMKNNKGEQAYKSLVRYNDAGHKPVIAALMAVENENGNSNPFDKTETPA